MIKLTDTYGNDVYINKNNVYFVRYPLPIETVSPINYKRPQAVVVFSGNHLSVLETVLEVVNLIK